MKRMKKKTGNPNVIFNYGSKISSILFLVLLLLSAGCDNGNDDGTAGGSGGSTIDNGATDLSYYLTAAINDEYRARDTYLAVIGKFGRVRPFTNIVNSEEQHISWLVSLFKTYGLPVPSDTVGGLAAPDTLGSSCSVGVQAEIANGALYDELLSGTRSYPDVQDVFKRLQSASLNQHLPAFQRCAN